MKNDYKRILTVVLSLCLILAGCLTAAFAATSSTDAEEASTEDASEVVDEDASEATEEEEDSTAAEEEEEDSTVAEEDASEAEDEEESTEAEVSTLLGDADCDGEITLKDARLALRANLELEALSDQGFENADLDGDGVISLAECRAILSVALELTSDYVIEEEESSVA